MFSGFVIFTYLGYMANRQDVNIDEVVAEGKVFLNFPIREGPFDTVTATLSV